MAARAHARALPCEDPNLSVLPTLFLPTVLRQGSPGLSPTAESASPSRNREGDTPCDLEKARNDTQCALPNPVRSRRSPKGLPNSRPAAANRSEEHTSELQ